MLTLDEEPGDQNFTTASPVILRGWIDLDFVLITNVFRDGRWMASPTEPMTMFGMTPVAGAVTDAARLPWG